MRKSCDIRLVVFDWAGTTIDFGCQAPTGAFVAAFAARGIEVTTAEVRRPMGLHKKDHIRAMLRAARIEDCWRMRESLNWTEDDVEQLYQDVTPRQIEAAALYSTLTPGVLECAAALRGSNIKIAATTGYFRAAAEVVYAAAKRQGYEPDFTICADEVPAGRPAPWMIYRCKEALGVYPPSAVVKVGDTLVDIEDGLNAGVWSIGVIDSSNEMGLSEVEFAALAPSERESRRSAIRERFLAAGAHAAIDTLAELPALIESLPFRSMNPADR